MKCVYLSPSVQQFNEYVNGGNEEQYMNLIADSVAKYLTEDGICYTRNSPDMSVGEIINQSNSGDYALHLAIHSNAAPEGLYGEITGSEVYYFPTSERASLLAQIIVSNLREIYPDPEKVTARTTRSFAELRRTRAPSVLVEVAYHDNEDDASWIKENIDEIGRALATSVKEFLDEICECELEDDERNFGEVVTMGGNLNMRSRPALSAPVIDSIPNGTQIELLECEGKWYKVLYNGREGYVFKLYVAVTR